MSLQVRRWAMLLLGVVFCCAPGLSYSVFTHEQLIDFTWASSMSPLLQLRFPGLSEAELHTAHAYAYGGCAIQDVGYYPFGESFFSDLTHYVRAGDFVSHLLADARDANEYAFALGALSHYVGDIDGHRMAINPATSLEFPKLAAHFGGSMTYDQNPHAHVRTEFGFDVEQLSRHHLAPSAYLRFIGLHVPRALLERAFFETYALHLNEVIGSKHPAFRSYRWAVRSFLPLIAHAETVIHRNGFAASGQGEVLRGYEANLAEADFQDVWNQYRGKPGLLTYFVAGLLRILPRVGPIADAAIRIPDDRTEQLYLASVNQSVGDFCGFLSRLRKQRGPLPLENKNLDTGLATQPGEYQLTDKTYSKLLQTLSERRRQIPIDLRANVLAYFDDPGALRHSRLPADQRRKIASLVAAARQN